MTHPTARHALVTGGSRGIGEAIVRRLAADGTHLAFTYVSDRNRADMLAAEITKTYAVTCQAVHADARDPAAVTDAVSTVLTQFGKLDILVNNAGVVRDRPMLMLDATEWLEVVNANLNGAFFATKAVFSTMLRQRAGSIVNISSVAGLIGVPGQTNYCAAKAGLIGMTRALARECASRNVRVNAVAPGFINTDMTAALDDKQKAEALASIPMKRFGEAADVAALVHFLTTGDAAYISGQVFVVDGGLTA
ncbi:MAG: 3-oxoacyl-ACP reductase FabG [Burkholderiales bacterium]